jgi:16S rRNA (cytidine1402-2'-O)-methyltransferase
LAAACGDERPAAVCRELTKLHEEVVRGRLGELAARAAEGGLTLRGEFVLVVGAGEAAATGHEAADDDARLEAALADVQRLVAAGTARGEAARRVAAATGIPRRRLYEPPADR